MKLDVLRRLSRVLILTVLLFTATVYAQNQAPRYDKAIKASQTVGALGKDLAGDSTNYYSGSTSFHNVDVSIPGSNALAVSVGRTYDVESGRMSAGYNPYPSTNNRIINTTRQFAFGDWDLDIPMLKGTFTQEFGWQLSSTTPLNRCSAIGQMTANGTPINGVPKKQSLSGGPYGSKFWDGYSLHVDGSDQSILLATANAATRPTSGGPFHWTTNQNWWISCLPQAANGAGEAFLAIAPDGTKYWFNWISRRDIDPLVFETDIEGAPRSIVRNTYRADVFMMPTRVEDRFGNWVQYQYSPDSFAKLQRIWSSDGREITLSYNETGLVSAISDGTRLTSYVYSGSSLAAVVLPDGSKWQYGFSGFDGLSLFYDVTEQCQIQDGGVQNYDCLGYPSTDASASGYVIHPSGARIDFTFATHYQWGDPTVEAVYSLALTEKTISGPGIAPQKWYYTFSPTVQEAQAQCRVGACPTRIWTDEVSPGYLMTRRMFGVQANVDQGLLLQELRGYLPTTTTTNTYSPTPYRINHTLRGGDLDLVDDGTPTTLTNTTTSITGPPVFLQETDYFYRIGQELGSNPSKHVWLQHAQVFWTERRTPVSQRTIFYGGASFTRKTEIFDQAFDRPLVVSHFNSYGNNNTEITSYYDHLGIWVLGQTATQQTCAGQVSSCDGYRSSRVQYDSTTALPTEQWAFGKLQQTMTYWPDGSLKTVTDARSNVTRLNDYYRGIPRQVQYPATPECPSGCSQSATVNDNGRITSVTDENGYVTGYGYDAMGRLASIVYPSDDQRPWNNLIRNITQVSTPEAGLPAGHWREVISTGDAKKITYYDALMRPVMTENFDAANGAATLSQSVTRYDADGRMVYQSYPSRGITDFNAPAQGTRTYYDALGRPIRSEQDSELGVLTTTTEYLSGLDVRVTNPRGFQTVNLYRAFDDPSAAELVGSLQPEGKTIEITRDVYGKPLTLTQRNASGSLSATRSYDYDVYQRLCRSVEPETGVTLQGYDAAGNLAWSAAGLPAGTPCEESGSSPVVAARKATRTYDARNRLLTLAFPDGRGNQAWEYTPDGLPSRAFAYNDPNNGSPVITAYHYNKRRLLDGQGESSQQPGWYTWGAGRGYDANANVNVQTYPTGLAVSFNPNALGQATAVAAPGNMYASGISYYPNGAIAQFTYGNGIVHTMGQNARQLPVQSVDAGVINLQTAFDANGNVSSVVDAVSGSNYNRSMTYDGLDRLLTAQSQHFGGTDGMHRFGYDALDNLTSWKLNGVKDYAVYAYDAASKRLLETRNSAGQTQVTLTYDAQGNLTSKNGQAYEFDYGNRLRAVINRAYYRYDALGRRVMDWRMGPAILSMYDQAGQLLFQHDGTDQTLKEQIYLAGSVLAIRSTPWAGGNATVKYQHTDALGSPVAVTNEAGQVIDRTDYEPYGAAIGKPAYNGVGYTGHVMDGGTGLTYMQQRYYDPQLGRFLSVDLVSANPNTGAMFNRYAYANNNPYKFTDPDGRQSARATAHDERRRRSDEVWGLLTTTAEVGAEKLSERSLLMRGLATLARIARANPMGAAIAGMTPTTLGDSSMQNVAARTLDAINTKWEPLKGQTIYRVWGGKSGPFGESWTPINPLLVRQAGLDYRNVAGLPNWNLGTHLSVGTLINPAAVMYAGPAAPFHGNVGGLPEYLIVKPELNVLINGEMRLDKEF